MKKLMPVAMLYCLACTGGVAAQDTSAIYGKYSVGGKGDPLGGNHLFVMKDHRYVVVFFGGAQLGTWAISRDNLVTFTPRMPAVRFGLYGRHNPDLKDSTRICFLQFSDEQTFIGLDQGSEAQPLLQRVFNPDPNCFGFPYVSYFSGIKRDVVFADSPYRNEETTEENALYPFSNPDGYNDFIAVYHTPNGEYKPFMARLTAKGLAFSENEIAKPGPIEEGEERAFLDALNRTDPNPATLFFNPRYNEALDVSADTLNYTYHKGKQAYISPLNYTEGEEYVKDADDFNRMSIVYPFRRVDAGVPLKRQFNIAEGSLFQVSCE